MSQSGRSKNSIKLNEIVLDDKTDLWKHQNSCHRNALDGFTQNFKRGFKFKYILVILFGLFRPRTLLKELLKFKNFKECFKFGLFLGGLVGSYKLILWTLRRILKSDRFSSLISGMISGAFIQFAGPAWKNEIALVSLSRALFTVLTALENNGIPSKIPQGNLLSVCTFWSYIVFIAGYHGELLTKKSTKLTTKWTFEKRNDRIFRYMWVWILKYKELRRHGRENEFDFAGEYLEAQKYADLLG